MIKRSSWVDFNWSFSFQIIISILPFSFSIKQKSFLSFHFSTIPTKYKWGKLKSFLFSYFFILSPFLSFHFSTPPIKRTLNLLIYTLEDMHHNWRMKIWCLQTHTKKLQYFSQLLMWYCDSNSIIFTYHATYTTFISINHNILVRYTYINESYT